VKNSNETAWHVNATSAGTMVSLAYEVEFSEGKGSEQFVFKVTGDKALLFNYNVNSPLLITK
jgi:subtilase family serine protease